MSDEMEEIISDFLIETEELIQDLDQKFIELEADKENQDIINDIFRSVHTIKGASGFLGFTQMVQLNHAAENVLKKIKEKEIVLTAQVMDVILETFDMSKVLLEHIKAKDGAQEDLTGIIKKLEEIYSTVKPKEVAHDEITRELPDLEGEIAAEEAKEAMVAEGAVESETIEHGAAGEETEEDASKQQIGEILVSDGKVTERDVHEALKVQNMIMDSIDTGEVPRVGEILTKIEKTSKDDVKKAVVRQGGQPEKEKAQTEQTIRVEVERLDNVLNLVGELVLARNRVMRVGTNLESKYPDNHDIAELSEANAFINLITTDLQLAVMKTRMQPVKKVFNRFPRMVRDLARAMNKEVELKLVGEETELDKSIIEEIGDPLVHLIRNSIDHGVEMPKDREQKGKPIKGTVKLSAYQEGNNIVLSIEDDGKGIDVERLREKILEKELASEEELERQSQRELLEYIFLPGFSTAKQVTDVSGRGVGMDVVKTNISKLNGTIYIETEQDVGTTFLIKLPLTLAIIQALMVGVGDEVYAIPLSSVVETVRLERKDIKTVRGQETVFLRDEVVPIHRLAKKFFITSASSEEALKVYMVVVLLGDKKFGIIVDKLFGQEEVVIKPIEGYSGSTEGLAGATITGDGKVVLILDPAAMF
ncbi:MAG: chemotaxis protein CheA [Candidatus Magnetoovum sp. WYHC-5]|nr:chemotaxis protein CheA [Candidatus Magnetoovum sp. WYHC-5]